MLRQLNLLPLLVIPVAIFVFGLRHDLIHAEWLTGPEKAVGPATRESFRLRSSKTQKSYDIDLQLPAAYAHSSQAFPVIYSVHDGPYLISYESVITPLLKRSQIPDVIVVNVRPATPEATPGQPRNPLENAARSAAWANDLTLEASVTRAGVAVGGKASDFADFFENELIPHVEQAYRCVPGDRCLAGFDIGALFALETVMTRPQLFDRVLAIAPVAQWADRAVIRLAERTLAAGYDPPIRLYMVIGEADNEGHVKSFKDLAALLESKKFKRARVETRILPFRRHADVVVPGAREGLEFLYANY